MEQPKPGAVAATARPWLLLLCLGHAVTAGVIQARAQPDSTYSFVSIDCGFPGTTSYVDENTTLPYVPDAAFTDAGENYNISAAAAAANVARRLSRSYQDVRSFRDGERNCYTIRSLTAGLKYLLRATFLYGNYDGLDRPPVFDLYLGVNFWKTVNVSDPDVPMVVEAIAVVPDDFVQVCLVNTDTGTPFISGLELRPLKSSLYPEVNKTQGLVLQTRRNFGPTDTDVVRYPDDPHDRIWIPWFDAATWTAISTTDTVNNLHDALFEVPSKVMQTAVTPRDASRNLGFYWDSKPQPKDPSPGYIPVMHFSELQVLPRGVVRQYYVNINGVLWSRGYYTPPYLYSGSIYGVHTLTDYTRYIVSMHATAYSTLPPIINAVEIFTVISTANVGTDSQDDSICVRTINVVSAMAAIKEKYQVKKNWMGDPCVAQTFAWVGLTCSYAISGPPRITGVNMSFSGLNGDISSAFASLKAVQSVDLSHNNLTGSIPGVLSQMPSLTFLDLTENQLSGSIPPGLLKKIQDGSLTLIYADNPNLCGNGDSCPVYRYADNPNLCGNGDSCPTEKGKSKVAIYVAVPLAVAVAVAVAVVLVIIFCLLRRKWRGSVKSLVERSNEKPTIHVPTADEHDGSLRLENRRFTFKDLKMITNNFQRVIGQGGFGYVYSGFLEDDTQVAVKLRSQSSNQGVKEFLTEAQILTRIHHKNLVSMIGYCKDGEYMALVYEYMSEGSLQEHIAGKQLTWRQRLRIALEAAQGLEYLHRGCNPPLIHRDVKATNILLDAKMEAKIADFGLSKAFNRGIDTHVSTNTLVGTPGYVDPEYQATMQPSTKSDVYSFGVVLLELITGKPAILLDVEPKTSIIQWTQERLERGDIEGVVDARMLGDHEINGVWKAAEVALACTLQSSAQRPTMADVVAQLQECLALEMSRRERAGDETGSFYTAAASGGRSSGYNAHVADRSADDVSKGSAGSEMEHTFGMIGPATG